MSYGQQQLQQHEQWREIHRRLWSPPVRADAPEAAPQPESKPEPQPIAAVPPPPAPTPVAIQDTREVRLAALKAELREINRKISEMQADKDFDLPPRRPPVQLIVRTVAHYFNVRAIDLLSHRRTHPITRWRQIAMYLAKQHTFCSLPEIGRRIGNRDHTTALSAIRRIDKLRGIDPEIEKYVTELTALLTLKDEQT